MERSCSTPLEFVAGFTTQETICTRASGKLFSWTEAKERLAIQNTMNLRFLSLEPYEFSFTVKGA